jgi:hypothetical protein
VTVPSPTPPTGPTSFAVFAEHLWKFIGGVLVLLAAGYGIHSASYALGKDAGASELAIYKKAEELDFNKLVDTAKSSTADLRSASAIFKDLLVTNAEYVNAKEQLDKVTITLQRYADDNKAFSERNKQLEAHLKSASDQITRLTTLGQSFTVKANDSVIVPFGRLNYGLQNVGPSGVSEIVINGTARQTKAGDTFNVDGVDDTLCMFNTRSTDFYAIPSTITFEVECKKK